MGLHYLKFGYFLTDLTPGLNYSGLAAGRDGSLYISALGTGPAAGQVLRAAGKWAWLWNCQPVQ